MITIFNRSVSRKIIVGIFATLISVSFASVSFNADIDARLRAKINSGDNNVTTFYDTGKIKIGTTVDNVTATLALKRSEYKPAYTEGKLSFIDFDSFSLEVVDLFSGLLHLQFFHWDFLAEPEDSGSDVTLLSDIKYVGMYFKVNPVDFFSFGLGYGAEGFMKAWIRDGEPAKFPKAVSHGIKSNFSFGGPVPIDLFVGATLVQGFSVDLTPQPEYAYNNETGQSELVGEMPTPVKGKIKFGLDRLQVGSTVKLYKNWVNAYAGMTMPKGGAVAYLKSPTDSKVKEDFVYVVGVGGDVPIMDTGLSIAYYLYYASDSFAKFLPNMIGDQITGIDDYILKANISPAYSLGIIKITLGLDVFMEEKWADVDPESITFDPKVARDNLMKAGVIGGYMHANVTKGELAQYIKPGGKRTPLGMSVEPKLTLTFAPGISVDFLYKVDLTGLTNKAPGVKKMGIAHTVGMNVKTKFGYTTD